MIKKLALIVVSTLVIVGALWLLQSRQPPRVLTVNYSNVSGKCLHDGKWVPVAGKFISWQISTADGARLTAPEFHHSHQLVEPLKKADSRMQNYEPAFFQREPYISNFKTVLDEKRLEMKNPKLILARIIYRSSEWDLYNLNKTRSPNPFNRDSVSDAVLVPANFTVCDFIEDVLMEDATANVSKRMFGGYAVSDDRTVPTTNGGPTFAQGWASSR
jgi:hypothetical protein